MFDRLAPLFCSQIIFRGMLRSRRLVWIGARPTNFAVSSVPGANAVECDPARIAYLFNSVANSNHFWPGARDSCVLRTLPVSLSAKPQITGACAQPKFGEREEFSARLANATVWRNLARLGDRQPRHILVVTIEEWVKLSTLEVSSRKASGWRGQKRQSKQDGWMTG